MLVKKREFFEYIVETTRIDARDLQIVIGRLGFYIMKNYNSYMKNGECYYRTPAESRQLTFELTEYVMNKYNEWLAAGVI